MRMLKFVKYLPQFGWMPVVLTTDPRWLHRGLPTDRTLLKELPEDVKVFRTLSPERLLGDVREKIFASNISPIRTSVLHESPLGKLVRSVKSFYVPQDGYTSWILFALPEAIRLVSLHKPDIVLTTSPPNWIHIIGYTLKEFLGVPWIADFRDGWVSNPLFAPRPAVRQRMESRLEKLTVSKADRIVSTTDFLTGDLVRRYPYLGSGKFVTIANGFDESDFEGIARMRDKDDKFVIVHVGGLSDTRTPRYLLEAIRMTIDEVPALRNELQLIIIGRVSGKALEEIESLSADYLPHKILLHLPFVEHRQALQYALDADVLWLVMHPEEGGCTAVPGKLYEYLRANRPILATVAEDSPSAELVNNLKIGIVAPPHDPYLIRRAIIELYRRHKQGKHYIGLDYTLMNRYSRKELTGQLALALDEVA